MSGLQVADRTDRVTSLTYRAPPYGILLATFLNKVADWIREDLQGSNRRIDVIHAHKLTIEGLIAQRLAWKLGCPFICSVRGKTDQLYLRAKPGKIFAYRKVASDAARLLPITPWIEGYLAGKLGTTLPHAELLPTITECEQIFPPSDARERFSTVFHLDAWRPKGMPNLLLAIQSLKAQGHDVGLDVIGGGTDAATRALESEISKQGLSDNVKLIGPLQHTEMQQTLNGYVAMVMPTLQETFGMVYVEALFSGVPILYSKNRGVDGFFDDVDIGYRCDPKSVSSICDGLRFLRSNESELKKNILEYQQRGGLNQFMKSNILEKYKSIVSSV